MKTGNIITTQNLKDALYPPDLNDSAMEVSSRPILDTGLLNEQERIRQALEQCGGSRTQAARLLGMDRSTLWRKMQKYQF